MTPRDSAKPMPRPAAGQGRGDVAAAPGAVRLHFIDGLRGLAMLMVLLYHGWLFGGMWQVHVPLGHRWIDAAPLLRNGHVGVNLFLVLSGFCLYWPFVKSTGRREPTLWEFARRRCRRILPPYYVVLLATGALIVHQARHAHGIGGGYVLEWLALHALMLHNTQPRFVLVGNGSLWSLGLESQLYVLFPLLVEAFRRFPARRVVLAVFLVCTAYRFVVTYGEFMPDDGFVYTLAYSVFGRCFEFALGMFAASAVADWHRGGASPLRRTDLAFAGAVLLLSILDGRHGHNQPLTDAAWGILFAGLLLCASRPESLASRLLSARWIVALGTFSYSVYLIHLPLVMAFGGWEDRHHPSNAAMIALDLGLIIPLILGLGYLFHLAFEKPFMNAPRPKDRPAPLPVAEPALILSKRTDPL